MLVEKALNEFGSRVVVGSKKELVKKGKNASSKLSKSLDYKLKVSKNSFQLDFLMEDYGKFIDKGVKGVGGRKADGSTWKKKRVTNNEYKYTNRKPPIKAFNGWTIKRGIAPRNNKGQFTTRKGLLYAIATSVYHTGLETTNFFTKPFQNSFNTLPDEVVEAYGLEVESLLKLALK